MKPGDRVEVHRIWAGGVDPIPEWIGGYVFVCMEDTALGSAVRVRKLGGRFAGCEFVYGGPQCVRLEPPPG